MIALWKCLFITIASTLVSGCALLAQPRGGVTLYAPVLSPSATLPPQADNHERRWQIEVAEPQAPAPLLGSRILVAPQPGRIEAYRGARWQDTPSTLLEALMIQALHEAGVPGAAGNTSMQRVDYRLESDLIRLQAEYRGAAIPIASICLYVRLVRVTDGQVVSSRVFSVDEPAADSTVPRVFDAFERAINRLVRETATWTVASGDHASLPSL